MRSKLSRLFTVASLAVIAGTCLQLGGCGFGDLGHFVANINPCGTILDCDPVQYQFITSGEPHTPACVFPPYCANDPFVSSGAGGA